MAQKRTNKLFIVFFCLLFEIVIYLMSFSLMGQNFDSGLLKTAEILLVVVYVLSIYVWCSYTKKIASIFFVLLACLLFNAGQVIVDLFGIKIISAYSNVFADYSTPTIIKALLFQSICVSSMILGAVLAFDNRVYLSEKVDCRRLDDNQIMDIVYVLSALVLLIICITNVLNRSNLSYADYYAEAEGISTPLVFIYHVLMYRELVIRDKTDRLLKSVHIINVMLLLAFLIVGSRSVVVQIVVGYVFIYANVKGKTVQLSFKRLLIYIAFGLLMLYLLTCFENLRNYSLSQINLSSILT